MKHPALEQLNLIMKEPREELREALLEEWQSKWVYYTENTQYVLNKSILRSDEVDFVWYKVAQDCAEDLMEDGITENHTTNTSFSCRVWAIRSPYAKLKENTKSDKETK